MKKRSASRVLFAALWVVVAMWGFATPCKATSMHKVMQKEAEALPPCHQKPVANTPCEDAPIADCYDSNKQLHNAEISAVTAYMWLVPATTVSTVATVSGFAPVRQPTAQAPPRPAFANLIYTSPRLRI